MKYPALSLLGQRARSSPAQEKQEATLAPPSPGGAFFDSRGDRKPGKSPEKRHRQHSTASRRALKAKPDRHRERTPRHKRSQRTTKRRQHAQVDRDRHRHDKHRTPQVHYTHLRHARQRVTRGQAGLGHGRPINKKKPVGRPRRVKSFVQAFKALPPSLTCSPQRHTLA